MDQDKLQILFSAVKTKSEHRVAQQWKNLLFFTHHTRYVCVCEAQEKCRWHNSHFMVPFWEVWKRLSFISTMTASIYLVMCRPGSRRWRRQHRHSHSWNHSWIHMFIYTSPILTEHAWHTHSGHRCTHASKPSLNILVRTPTASKSVCALSLTGHYVKMDLISNEPRSTIKELTSIFQRH